MKKIAFLFLALFACLLCWPSGGQLPAKLGGAAPGASPPAERLPPAAVLPHDLTREPVKTGDQAPEPISLTPGRAWDVAELESMGVQERCEAILLDKRSRSLHRSQKMHSLDRLETIVSDRSLNVDGKALTEEQSRQLGELVDSLNEQKVSAAAVFRELHSSASLVALRSGQYEALHCSGSSSESQQLMVGEAMRRLGDRLGVELRDWRCENVFWSSSNGTSQRVLIWYTAAQNADCFQAADALRALSKERSDRYRRFFAGV
jgi:hypothetical protein